MGRGKKSIIKLPAFTLQASLLLFLLSGFVVFSPVTAEAQSAKTWNKRGQKAEVREDYDTAYEDYRQATLKDPKDLAYKAHFERMRFQAGVSHIDRGRVLRQSGDLSGALSEFLRAHQIDPSNQTAEQEIDRIQHPEASTHASPAPVPSDSSNAPGTRRAAILNELNSIAGPIQLKPVSDNTITLHMVEDVKVIYQAIGKLAGLNVLFDPDYTSKRIPIDLTNVTLSDALRIVGTVSGTFYKPITSNSIFVAANTRTKRAELQDEAVQTFYLTNASQLSDANEVLTAIRSQLDPTTKINLVPSQNAIVIRSTPDQLLLAQKLINDLDRARPEVVVDIAILEVNRDKVRQLGLTLPQSVSITPQASPTTTASGSGTGTGTGGTPAAAVSNFTLNSLAHLNATNFAVGINGATLNALLTDADTRILQNPSIRATDGQKAQLKIGQRIPYATGSYNAGVSTGIASIGVQTQFQYVDIGVQIEMTPTVHYDNEISLKMKVEVSSNPNNVTISGVSEPVIGQRLIDQTIQLKEGEPSILAGILTKQNNLTVDGTPGIGELPIFKYLFSSRKTEKAQDEIVFLLIPHIVRESVLTRLNTRAIDTGTGQSIELRHVDAAEQAGMDLGNPGFVNSRPASTGPATSAANAAAAMVQQMQKQAQPLTPPPASTAAPSGPPVSLNVVAPTSAQAVGSTFQVSVMLGNGRDIYSVPLQMQFNPKVLELVNVDSGNFLGSDGQAVALVHRDDGNGLVTISSSRPPNVPGVSGQGSLCTLTFKAVAAGDSNLALVKVGARNSAQANLPAVGSQAVVHVK